MNFGSENPEERPASSSYRQRNKIDDEGGDGGSPSSAPTNQIVDKIVSELKDDLKPLEPSEGIDRYLRHRTDITEKTKQEYRRKLGWFEKWTQQVGIENLNTLSGREITAYRRWRREESTDEPESLSPTTMRDDLFLLRDFLRFLESIEAVEAGLAEKITIPEAENVGRDIELASERLERILEYLDKFEYATLDHVLFCLLKETGRRIGGIYALDLADYHEDSQEPYLEFCHRPGETRLKNGEASEGQVALSPAVNTVLTDYIETHRHQVEDEYGREPLLTTTHGRPAKSTLRRLVYKWTRPCQIGRTCPHGQSPESCKAAVNADSASKCESSRPPHALRHGYLTELQREGVPTKVIQERCDVSEEVLEKHYDERTEEEKRQRRKEILDELRNGGGYL